MFSWKSEAVLYSDHDRCYLFIPKQARLPPPPLVYLSATLAPLSSLLLFDPALSIRIYIFLPLSFSFCFSSFLERAAPSSCLRLLLQNWSKSRIRTPWSWRIEGYRTIGGRGRGWITRGANVTRTPLVVSFEPCFETISSMVSGLYRDIYRGEERFPCTGGFSRVSWWIGLKKKKEESFESIAITIVCQVACNYLFEYISSIFIYLFLRANWDF